MEVIKRKILLEDSTDRTTTDMTLWGKIPKNTVFYINVLLTQDVDDMGLFTDLSYVPKENNATVNYGPLISKLNSLGNVVQFPFMSGSQAIPLTNVSVTEKYTLRLPTASATTYFAFGNHPITGATDSKIEDVRSYDITNPFRVNFNTSEQYYENYTHFGFIGVDRIITSVEPKIYVFDTKDDVNLGTNNQIYGLQYLDYTGQSREVIIEEIRQIIPLTTFRFIGEGWNATNVSLSALTKEEYLFGIISPPEVESDVFIDRGVTTVMDLHLRMSEIKNLGELSRYGNGCYNINKQ